MHHLFDKCFALFIGCRDFSNSYFFACNFDEYFELFIAGVSKSIWHESRIRAFSETFIRNRQQLCHSHMLKFKNPVYILLNELLRNNFHPSKYTNCKKNVLYQSSTFVLAFEKLLACLSFDATCLEVKGSFQIGI